MPGQGIITKIGYRICDWVGNTIIEPLPHLHESSWTITAMQQGQPGSVSIGTFTIPLFPPRSTEYLQNKGIYSLIKYGQRIEAYVLGESGDYVNGVPAWSGIIYKIDKELDKYEISGFDSLWLANQQIFYPGQQYPPTTGGSPINVASGLLDLFNDIETLLFIDDFAGNRYPSYAPAWTTVIGTGWSTATQDSLPGLQNNQGSGGENVIITTAAKTGFSGTDIWSTNQSDSIVYSSWFHFISPSISNGVALGMGMVIGANAGATSLYLGEVATIGNGTTYDVHGRIWVKSSGVYSNIVDKTFFTAQLGDFRGQITLIVEGNSTNTPITMLINGKDAGCTTAATNTSITEFGPNFGFRQLPPANIFFTRPYVKKRAQTWPGPPDYPQPILPFTDAGGPLVVSSDLIVTNLDLSGMNLLDLWSIGAAGNNWVWRKDVRRMVVQAAFSDVGDPISWGTQGVDIGLDLSAQIVLDESINIVSGGAVANADHIATEIAFGFNPSSNGGGRINWPDAPGILNLGQGPQNLAPPLVITDIINITGLTDMLLARRMVESVGAQKALTVGQAKTFTILRTPDLSTPRLDILSTQADTDFNGNLFQGFCPQAFRELDFVTLNCPSLDIFNAKVSVMGYTFRESDPTFDVVLDQFTSNSKHVIDRRRWNNIDIALLNYTPRS